MDWHGRILVTGGYGMVGHALQNEMFSKIHYPNITFLKHEDCDLRDPSATWKMMTELHPEYIFHLAAHVHGLGGNQKYKSDVLYNNVMINTNVIECARRIGVKKIIVMGSGCVYSEMVSETGLCENQIWTGKPHSSEDSYAQAKRLMLAQLEAVKEQYGIDYAFAVSGNLYGEYDKFDIENGHVIPSLIAKFYSAAKSGHPVSVWGKGIAVRDFMYGGDAAKALILLMERGSGAINIGSGCHSSINNIVYILKGITGVRVEWDTEKPDGQLIRYYNLDKLNLLGFKPLFDLETGIQLVYKWYSEEQK